VEWEAAAGGRAGRIYPYGKRFDPLKNNTFETHIRRTTPVGIFANGRTPEGVYDLSGNVWEWTRSLWGERWQSPDYAYPYDAQDGREDPEAPPQARRVVRGGSWLFNQASARASSRNSPLPDNRDDYLGFRVVRRPPSQNH
jgi:formylglycine-generating enzyme required for sulfatase activity